MLEDVEAHRSLAVARLAAEMQTRKGRNDGGRAIGQQVV
jgi:hypothetical protein